MLSLDLGFDSAELEQIKDVQQIKSEFRKIKKMNRLQHAVCSVISNVITKSESVANNRVKKLFH